MIRVWLGGLTVGGWRLHTHVPLGFDRADTGEAIDSSLGVDPEAYLSFRADAVLEFADHVWMVEGKPRCRHHAVGQVKAYAFWWRENEGFKACERLIIVTDVCSEPVRRFAEYEGVEVVEVGEVLGLEGGAGYFVAAE